MALCCQFSVDSQQKLLKILKLFIQLTYEILKNTFLDTYFGVQQFLKGRDATGLPSIVSQQRVSLFAKISKFNWMKLSLFQWKK